MAEPAMEMRTFRERIIAVLLADFLVDRAQIRRNPVGGIDLEISECTLFIVYAEKSDMPCLSVSLHSQS